MTKIDAQPEALRCADALENYAFRPALAAARELRRLHAENAAQAQQIAQDRADAARADQAEDALLKVLAEAQRYLPPDGPTAHEAMSNIIAIVDPWPLASMKEKTP